MDNNQLKAFVRSVFPFLESAVVALVTKYSAHISPVTMTYIVGFGGTAITAVVHWLETRFPWVGVFLGWIGAPKYAPTLKKVLSLNLDQAQAQIAQLQDELNSWKNATPATGTATLSTSGDATP